MITIDTLKITALAGLTALMMSCKSEQTHPSRIAMPSNNDRNNVFERYNDCSSQIAIDFDDNGNKVFQGYDENCDGVYEKSLESEFDEENRKISEKEYRGEKLIRTYKWMYPRINPDGSEDLLTQFEFDGRGRLIRQTTDDDGDGKYDSELTAEGWRDIND